MANSLKELLAKKKLEAQTKPTFTLVRTDDSLSLPKENVQTNSATVQSDSYAQQSASQASSIQSQVSEIPSDADAPVIQTATGAGTAITRSEQPSHPLVMQLAELQQALTNQIPGFATVLKDIHEKLRADPAIVPLMSDEEISIVVSGLSRHAQIEIVNPKAVKDAKKMVKGVKIAADDL